jgi:hypothetical protein
MHQLPETQSRDYKGLRSSKLITETFAKSFKAKYLSKIDIYNTYSLVGEREKDVWKTAIFTCYGLFEFLVILFGLTTAPTIF